MTTLLIENPAGLDHATPPGHPEQIARLEAVFAALSVAEFGALDRMEAPEAELADLLLGHPQAYVDATKAAMPATGRVSLDADTHASPGSWRAVLKGVGGCLAGIDAVLEGRVRNAFVATRPPGHHAEQTTAMGFCLFSNIAIAARYALERKGLARVAVVDFDVHHGNGTQDVLWDEPRALFASTHQSPLWPGTGAAHETGPHGTILNVPLAPHTGSDGFRRACEDTVFPHVRAFRPELILVSAGFDAHRKDPLAELMLETGDFAWVTERLCDLADELCEGRLVSSLEGGYDLNALADSTAAHVDVLIARGAA